MKINIAIIGSPNSPSIEQLAYLITGSTTKEVYNDDFYVYENKYFNVIVDNNNDSISTYPTICDVLIITKDISKDYNLEEQLTKKQIMCYYKLFIITDIDYYDYKLVDDNEKITFDDSSIQEEIIKFIENNNLIDVKHYFLSKYAYFFTKLINSFKELTNKEKDEIGRYEKSEKEWKKLGQQRKDEYLITISKQLTKSKKQFEERMTEYGWGSIENNINEYTDNEEKIFKLRYDFLFNKKIITNLQLNKKNIDYVFDVCVNITTHTDDNMNLLLDFINKFIDEHKIENNLQSLLDFFKKLKKLLSLESEIITQYYMNFVKNICDFVHKEYNENKLNFGETVSYMKLLDYDKLDEFIQSKTNIEYNNNDDEIIDLAKTMLLNKYITKEQMQKTLFNSIIKKITYNQPTPPNKEGIFDIVDIEQKLQYFFTLKYLLSSNKNHIDFEQRQVIKSLLSQMIFKCFTITNNLKNYYYIYSPDDLSIQINIEKFYCLSFHGTIFTSVYGITYKKEALAEYVSEDETDKSENDSNNQSNNDSSESEEETVSEKQIMKVSKKSVVRA